MKTANILALFLVGMIGCNTPTVSSKTPDVQPTTENSTLTSTIQQLITMLGDDDWKIREKAQKQLEDLPVDEIESIVKEATESKDLEVKSRAERILKVAEVKKRVKFSDSFLNKFPNVYCDLAKMNMDDKFEFLQKVTACNDENQYEYKNIVTNTDVASLFGEVLLEEGRGLTREEKLIIIAMSNGDFVNPYRFDGPGIQGGGWWQPIPESAPYIIKLLNDEDDGIRYYTAESLGNLGAKEAIPALILLKNKYNGNSEEEQLSSFFAAPEALSKLCTKEAIPELINFLKDKDSEVRRYVTDVLSKLGAKESIPELIKLLNDEDAKVREEAVWSLGQLGAKEAVPELMKLLKDKNADVRGYAAASMGYLSVKEAIPILIGFLKDENWRVRGFAAQALGKLGVKEIIPELIKLLSDQDEDVRWYATDALGKLGAKEAIPELIKLLKDNDYNIRRYVPNVLSKLGAKEAITDMVKLLKDNESEIRGWAAIALVELCAKDKVPKEVIEDIKPILNWGGDSGTRAQAALKELGVEVK
ncbi:MAG: HEAT repeat domain-containing protein [Planctomycetota bacterium]